MAVSSAALRRKLAELAARVRQLEFETQGRELIEFAGPSLLPPAKLGSPTRDDWGRFKGRSGGGDVRDQMRKAYGFGGDEVRRRLLFSVLRDASPDTRRRAGLE